MQKVQIDKPTRPEFVYRFLAASARAALAELRANASTLQGEAAEQARAVANTLQNALEAYDNLPEPALITRWDDKAGRFVPVMRKGE